MESPIALAFNVIDNSLLVVEHGGHRVQVFDPSSTKTKFIIGKQGKNDGEFQNPEGVVTDSQTGTIYISDFANQRIQVTNICWPSAKSIILMPF